MKISDIVKYGNLKVFNNLLDFELEVGGFKIDSREIQPRDVFVALKGRFESGEDYVQQAIDNGACCAIVSDEYNGESDLVLRADDVLISLGLIAKNYIRTQAVNIIAVSGSVGKSSTKEAIHAMLSEKYRTFKTLGNFNSEIGLPLTLLSITSDYEYAVIEMGMERAGEIAYLSDITGHKLAVLTNIGTSHIASFGSRKGIFYEKMNITEYFDKDGILFVNSCDDMLRNVDSDVYEVVKYGSESDVAYASDIVVSENGTSFKLHLADRCYGVSLEMLGVHNARNIACAAAISMRLGISDAQVLSGIKKIKNIQMRFEIFSKHGIMYIKDFYNSSYESITNAMESFKTLNGNRKIVVLGNINECGELIAQIHSSVGMLLNKYSLDQVCFVGEFMKHAFKVYTGEKLYFEDVMTVREYLKQNLRTGDIVLLKASRFMEFERILENDN